MSGTTTAPPATNAPDPVVRYGMYFVLAVAMYASAKTLADVAHHAGWHGPSAWLVPALIDVPGLLAGRIWLRRAATTPDTRRYARRFTLTTLLVSIAGNIVGHLMGAGPLRDAAGDLRVPLLLLVVAGAVLAPLMLWAILHLDALLTPGAAPAAKRRARRTDDTARSATHAETEGGTTSPDTSRDTDRDSRTGTTTQSRTGTATQSRRRDAGTRRTGTTQQSGTARGTDKQATARAHWDSERAQGRTPTGKELATVAGVDPSYGRRWRREWEKEPATTDPGPATHPASAADTSPDPQTTDAAAVEPNPAGALTVVTDDDGRAA